MQEVNIIYKIKEYRQSRKLSLRGLGKLSGVSHTQIAEVEKKRRRTNDSLYPCINCFSP